MIFCKEKKRMNHHHPSFLFFSWCLTMIVIIIITQQSSQQPSSSSSNTLFSGTALSFVKAFTTTRTLFPNRIQPTITIITTDHNRHQHPFSKPLLFSKRRTIMSAKAGGTTNTNTTPTRKKRTTTKKKKDPPLTCNVTFVSKEYLPSWMNPERTRVLTESNTDTDTATATATATTTTTEKEKCVYYWMQRELRTQDNWALLFAQHLAQMQNVPLRVLYVLPCPYIPPTNNTDTSSSATNTNTNTNTNTSSTSLPPKVCEINMTKRHASFLIDGLQTVQNELQAKNVSFHILQPISHDVVGQTVHDFVMATTDTVTTAKTGAAIHTATASVVVCDMNPLRQYRNWIDDQTTPLLKESGVSFYQVDAHNVVPVWFASPKREVGARTLRPKINKLLPEFMTQFPEFEGNTQHIKESKKDEHKNSNIINWDEYYTYLKCDESIPPVPWAKAGKEAAMERFQEFCTNKEQGLKQFDTLRNDPNYQNVCSNLSPWINYGMVSFQRLALDVRKLKKYPNGTASYIEEGIVRRELSDNFVYYTKDNYDELTCAAVWAQESLELHSVDEREYLYTFEELEGGKTHDDLWNAAQIQLVSEGQMHGFLRMYWAKKILEWTESPKVALRTGLYFNDRYALDGNDPNGFTGVGWSVMGIHDMGWKERPIFGKIRFMNYAGCKRKFKVDTFVSRYRDARLNAIKVEAKVGKKVDVKKTGKKRKAPSR